MLRYESAHPNNCLSMQSNFNCKLLVITYLSKNKSNDCVFTRESGTQRHLNSKQHEDINIQYETIDTRAKRGGRY